MVTLGDALDFKTTELTQKTIALKAQVEEDVAANIQELKADVGSRVQVGSKLTDVHSARVVLDCCHIRVHASSLDSV